MRIRPSCVAAVAALALVFAPSARAHDSAPAPVAASVQAEMHKQLEATGKKLIELAEVTPPDKLEWRPMEGVRSSGEVFLHVATANYLMSGMLGKAVPAGLEPAKFESTVKDKDQMVKLLRESFDAAYAAIDGTTDLDTKVKVFGSEATKRYAMLMLVVNAHEHLGQSIAYARSNRITPPWTARAQAAAAAKKAEADAKAAETGTKK